MATRDDPQARRNSKLRLVKKLFRSRHSKEDVRRLFGLIDWLLTLPDDLEEAFRTDVHQYEEEEAVEYMSSIERYGYKKGREEGLTKGERIGLLEGIALALDAKFGASGRKLVKKVRSLSSVDELRNFARILKSAKNVDELRRHLE
jgi:hypothetical protein